MKQLITYSRHDRVKYRAQYASDSKDESQGDSTTATGHQAQYAAEAGEDAEDDNTVVEDDEMETQH